jgi:dipeptidyl-peptidase-4
MDNGRGTFFEWFDHFATVKGVVYYQKPGTHMYFLLPGEENLMSSKRFRAATLFLTSLLVLFFAAFSAMAQVQRPPLTAEWIFGKEGSSVAEVPEFKWLADNSAILCDTRQPEAQRTFERLDPITRERHPDLDMPKAVASLTSLDPSSEIKQALPWPDSFDANGRQALYIFHGDIFLLDFPSSSFTRVTNTPAEEKDAEFSPDGRLLSFVRSNDLYVYDIAAKKEMRLTSDGSDTLLNGTLTWVYWEEIFGRRDIGYWWSPDSRAIAFLQTDVTEVADSTFVDFQPVDERIIHQRYPKPGEKNPRVRVGVTDVFNPQTRWVNLGAEPFEWIQRVKWLPDSERLSIQTMPRSQKENRLDFINVKTGERKHILTETDPAWVNVTDDLHFLPGGRYFLWASERDGFMHLYRFTMDGTLVNQITNGNWAMASSGGVFWVRQAVAGIDSENDWIYFTALKDSSIERNLYRVKSDGSGLTRLSAESGAHAISMSPNAKFYFDSFSNNRTLPSLQLHAAEGKLLQTLAAPRPELLPEGIQYSEFLTVPAADGFPMPTEIWKPRNFDPARKYPVILYVYGGPSAPNVVNEWSAEMSLYNQLLLQDGFVVMYIDNRAATGISKKLENTIAANPAASESDDLLAGVRWFKSQPWVDASRFGVWGWSGGGTMTLNLMTRSKEFKAGISVAPVTDWHYYDSKWAESLMGLPSQNAEAYDRTSLVKHAGDLSGQLMVAFGTYDDNVHPQNEQAFLNELIAKDILYEVMIYPMRKHGITDPPATIHLFRTMREFWRRNL